jgi:hypothetical protein
VKLEKVERAQYDSLIFIAREERGGNQDINKEEILRAIDHMKKAKTTHEKWIDFLDQNPEYDSKQVGNLEHHHKWVDRYDETIEILSSFLLSVRARARLLKLRDLQIS